MVYVRILGNRYLLDALVIHINKSSGTQPDIFQGRGGFVELGHFDKLFVKNTKKRLLSPRYS